MLIPTAGTIFTLEVPRGAVDLDPVAFMIRQSVYSVEQFGLPGVEEERASCACCQRYCVGGGDATSSCCIR